MSDVMELDGCHQCKTLDPKEAMVVDIVTDGLCSNFHGMFDLIVHPEGTDSSEKKTERNWKTQIFFTIEGAESFPVEQARTSRKSSNLVESGNQCQVWIYLQI